MRDRRPAVMLFAAGFGTRMGEITRQTPKPLIHVARKPLIDHAIELAHTAGLTDLVANTHYLADQVQAHLAPYDIKISHEPGPILDTGGGLRAALPLLGTNPVVTLNTDVIFAGPNPVTAILEHWDPINMDALLTCVPVKQCRNYAGKGDFDLNSQGQISRGSDYVYGSVQILKTDLLADIPEQSFSLNAVWDMMGQRGRLFGLPYPGQWCDVGTPDGITAAEAMLAE